MSILLNPLATGPGTGHLSSLMVLVVFSISIKKPFTLQFAMEKVPEQYWGTNQFVRISTVISWAWALQFTLALLFSLLHVFVYNGNGVLRVVPGLVVLILTLQFTAKYPAYAKARAQHLSPQSQQQQQEEGEVSSSFTSALLVDDDQ